MRTQQLLGLVLLLGLFLLLGLVPLRYVDTQLLLQAVSLRKLLSFPSQPPNQN